MTSKNSIDLSDISTILQQGAAVTLHQPLQSSLLEDAGQRLYPPTFPDLEGYFIDTLPGNRTRCTIDTKQSQARRLAKKLIEINASQPTDGKLLPQVTVSGNAATRSIGEIGHRVADAAVLLSTLVGERARTAMSDYNSGDATALGIYFPESLLFGFWDSHSIAGANATHTKRSRIIHSEVHAYEVAPVRAKSVYVAAAPQLMSGEEYDTDKADEKLSEAGLANAIGDATRDGVVAKTIARSAEINLAALRQIACRDSNRTGVLQSYLFHLALVAVGWPDSDELNLRSGTLLVPVPDTAKWSVLMRDGRRLEFQIPQDLLAATKKAAKAWFGADMPPALEGRIESGKVAKVRESLRTKGKKGAKGAATETPTSKSEE